MTLEELLKAQGLSDEQIKAITASMKENKIYTASEENLDIRYGKLKTDYDTLNTQHGESTKLIEQLKKDAKNDEALQGKITAYETQVANLQKELDETRLESAIKVALMNAKTDDVGYMAFKLKEGGALELDEDGNIMDLKNHYTVTSGTTVTANACVKDGISRTLSGSSATTGLTDIYAVKFDVNDGFHAATITGSSAISQYLPDFNQPGAVKDGEVEMVAATVLKNTKHAGVLRNVKIA